MALDLDNLATALRSALRVGLGMAENSVRPANQNAPTGAEPPTAPYATVLLYTAEPEGQDDHSIEAIDESDDVTEKLEGQRHLVASVQFFGAGAVGLANRVRPVLCLNASKVTLRAAGLGLVKAGMVKDLSKVLDTYWEERAQLDVELYAISTESATLPTFGTFPHSEVLQ